MNACGASLAENLSDPCLRQAKLTHFSQINEIILNEGKAWLATLQSNPWTFQMSIVSFTTRTVLSRDRSLSTDAGADKNFTPQTVAPHGPSVFRRGFVVFNLLTQ